MNEELFSTFVDEMITNNRDTESIYIQCLDTENRDNLIQKMQTILGTNCVVRNCENHMCISAEEKPTTIRVIYKPQLDNVEILKNSILTSFKNEIKENIASLTKEECSDFTTTEEVVG